MKKHKSVSIWCNESKRCRFVRHNTSFDNKFLAQARRTVNALEGSTLSEFEVERVGDRWIVYGNGAGVSVLCFDVHVSLLNKILKL